MAALVQVTFRDIPHSDAVEAHVARRAAKLETFFGRMVRCHAVVEKPHRRHRHGKGYHVRVGMHVPGKELVITRNQDDDCENLHATIEAAFDDAERVLDTYARRLRVNRTVHQGA